MTCARSWAIALPDDHAGQAIAQDMAALALRDAASPAVLDVGCGAGASVDLFRGLAPGARWVGVDVADSPEVRQRTRTDADFHTFDGVNLPFGDESFDLVYCTQVLEHVRRPAPLLADMSRVLRPGDGSPDPRRRWSPSTPAAPSTTPRTAWPSSWRRRGSKVCQLRPSIDALTLIARRGLGGPAFFDRWWTTESPLNRAIGLFGRVRGLDVRGVNAAKLLFAGHVAFAARKPG